MRGHLDKGHAGQTQTFVLDLVDETVAKTLGSGGPARRGHGENPGVTLRTMP
jgi:hypothetical protein